MNKSMTIIRESVVVKSIQFKASWKPFCRFNVLFVGSTSDYVFDIVELYLRKNVKDAVVETDRSEGYVPEHRIIEETDFLFIVLSSADSKDLSYALQIANRVRDAGNKLTFGLSILPIGFNAKKVSKELQGQLDCFIKAVDCFFVFPNELDQRADDVPAFSYASTAVIDSINQLLMNIEHLLFKKSRVAIDFVDIKKILSSGGIASFDSGTASGSNRAVNAARLATKDQRLRHSKRIVAAVYVPSSESFEEIDQVGEILDETGADWVVGFFIDDSYGDSVTVTVVSTYFN